MSLPRSAVLASWLAAVVAGRTPVGDAASAVAGDEDHEVRWVASAVAGEMLGHPVPDPAYLSDFMVIVAMAAERRGAQVRVALPVPGDAGGLPPATGLVGHACDAGECVVVEGLHAGSPGGEGTPVQLTCVPEITMYGTEVEPGYHVTWTTWATDRPVPASALAGPASVAEADLELRLAVRDVTRELERLEVAAWTHAERGRSRPRLDALPPLPGTFSDRSRTLLASAAQILSIVDAAGDEPGGVVTGHEVGLRAAALARAHQAARRAVEASVNLPD